MNGTIEMAILEAKKIHGLLCADGRKLENFKVFPGSNRGLTSQHLCDEADKMIAAAFAGGLKDNPPMSGNIILDESPSAWPTRNARQRPSVV